jgi:hypothetical protein
MYQSIEIDDRTFWVVLNDRDDAGYNHEVSLRDGAGNRIWAYEVRPPESIVESKVQPAMIVIWTGSGYMVELDIRSGKVLRTVFVK